jgi:hypothetical protein
MTYDLTVSVYWNLPRDPYLFRILEDTFDISTTKGTSWSCNLMEVQIQTPTAEQIDALPSRILCEELLVILKDRI